MDEFYPQPATRLPLQIHDVALTKTGAQIVLYNRRELPYPLQALDIEVLSGAAKRPYSYLADEWRRQSLKVRVPAVIPAKSHRTCDVDLGCDPNNILSLNIRQATNHRIDGNEKYRSFHFNVPIGGLTAPAPRPAEIIKIDHLTVAHGQDGTLFVMPVIKYEADGLSVIPPEKKILIKRLFYVVYQRDERTNKPEERSVALFKTIKRGGIATPRNAIRIPPYCHFTLFTQIAVEDRILPLGATLIQHGDAGTRGVSLETQSLKLKPYASTP
ncbi:MAG: hypothetical protein AB7E52_05280 [Bdellovibrionales bacterium]